MSKANNLGDFLLGIANAIRTKKGTSGTINPQNFETEIAGISGKLPQVVDRSITEVTSDDLSGITSIGNYAFDNCTSLTSITIPDSVTSIGNNAFDNCTSLTNVTLGDNVTSIGGYAFQRCDLLENITLPDRVTSIGNYAFFRCTSITSITIPDRVTSIGSNAFERCTSLTGITITASIPPTLSSANAFNSTNNCPIYVPSGSVTAYQTATNWSSLSSRIQAIPT